MKHGVAHEEIMEWAAMYALGSLSQQEARAFEEHLAEGCDVCRAELASFEGVVSELSLSVEEQEPPLGLRDELIRRTGASAMAKGEDELTTELPSQILSIYANEGEWRETLKGIFVKNLFVDKQKDLTTSLVKMLPGTRLPIHRHKGIEQLFILEGDCHIHGHVLGPGDYHRAEAGTVHETTYTIEGTTFLLIAPSRYLVFDVQ